MHAELNAPGDIFSAAELAAGLALVSDPESAMARAVELTEPVEAPHGSAGGAITMDTLVLLQLAAEQLGRKVAIVAAAIPRETYERRLQELRRALDESARRG